MLAKQLLHQVLAELRARDLLPDSLTKRERVTSQVQPTYSQPYNKKAVEDALLAKQALEAGTNIGYQRQTVYALSQWIKTN